MNEKDFSKDPLTSFMLGVDDDKLEDMSLEEVLDRVIRNKTKDQDIPLNEVEEKVAKMKNRLANFIATMDANSSNGANPLIPLLLLLSSSGSLVTHGFRGTFTDKDGNPMPEDVFKNKFMPLSRKATSIDTVIKNLEELTEDNIFSVTIPDIVRNLFACKDELLELLKGRKAYFDEELKKILECHYK